jgi:hypothetical protein
MGGGTGGAGLGLAGFGAGLSGPTGLSGAVAQPPSKLTIQSSFKELK